MLSGTDTALDLLVLELVLHAALLRLLLLRVLAPVDGWLEDDVLADGGGVHGWPWLVLLGETEFAPALALSDARADDLLHDSCANPPGRLDLLALVIDAP
jgi:hypothetical protein